MTKPTVSDCVVLSSRIDPVSRGIAAALRRAFEARDEEPNGGTAPIALPATAQANETGGHLDGVDVALALDSEQAERAREAGVRTVIQCCPWLSFEGDAPIADRVLVTHEALVHEVVAAGGRRDQVVVCGPVAPDGWSPADDRAELREKLELPDALPWVVVHAEALDRVDIAPALVQLSLVERRAVWLFDVGLDAGLARTLRRAVPGYGLTAHMFAEGPEALPVYRAADAVLGRLDGPEAIRAFSVGASMIALPPRSHELRLAHLLETSGLVDVADASATLAVTLDSALATAALEKAKSASRATEAAEGAGRVAAIIDDLLNAPADISARPAGLPCGIERLSDPEDAIETAELGPGRESRPSPAADEKQIDEELAALREKLGL